MPSSEPRQSSVQAGQLVRCSVSQFKTFDTSKHGGCERKWAWQKIWGKEDEGGKGAKDSTKCHTIAETYLKEGFLPLGTNDLERSFLAGKHMLPERGTWLKVESKFDGELSLADVPFNGRIDLMDLRNELEGAGYSVEVGDHKFHGDIARMLSEEEMRSDPQMLGYGMVAIALYPGLTHVRLTHYNYQKTKPFPSQKVSIILGVDEIRTRWASLEALVVRMKRMAGAKNPSEVPANRDACFAWGKSNACPHLALCNGVKEMGPIFSAEEEAVFGVTAPPAVIARPTLIMPECSACGESLSPDNGSQRAGVWKHIGCKGVAHADAAVAVLPPDAPKSDPELAAACEACEGEKNFQHRPSECPKAGEPVAGPGKRKRRTKAEMEAARALSAGASVPVQAGLPEIINPTAVCEVTAEAESAPIVPQATLPAEVIVDLHQLANREERNVLARDIVLEVIRAGARVEAQAIVDYAFTAADYFIARSNK